MTFEKSAPTSRNVTAAPVQKQNDGGKHGRVYAYLVDTLATVSFWTPVGMAQEVLIAGMTVGQSLKVRGISVVVNTFLARPYGVYRDRLFKLLRTTEKSSQMRKFWTDYMIFSSFWTPVYAGMLAAGGADEHQIIKACAAGLVANMVTGRPFGAYFDLVRRKTGLKPAGALK